MGRWKVPVDAIVSAWGKVRAQDEKRVRVAMGVNCISLGKSASSRLWADARDSYLYCISLGKSASSRPTHSGYTGSMDCISLGKSASSRPLPRAAHRRHHCISLGKSANSRLLVLRVRARGDCVSLGKGAISVKAIFMQIRISPFFALDTNAPQFVDNTGAKRKQAEQDFINPWEAALFARPSSSFATKGWPGKACQSPRALEGQQRSMIR